jgi:hypothetical protein
MTERTADPKSSRREILKIGGAAALGAAGLAAMGTRGVKAAGSGATIAWIYNPQRLTSGHLASNAEVVIGPFLYPGTTFDSTNYYGIVGNLTAMNWKGKDGWLTARPNTTPFQPGTQAIDLHFGGKVKAWTNFFMTVFGFEGGGGSQSDGKFIIRNGPIPTDYEVDLLGFLNIDQ